MKHALWNLNGYLARMVRYHPHILHFVSGKAFKESYVLFMLNSDNQRLYEPGEGERIFVKAQASPLETTYYLVALGSREGSELAQTIADMFNACMKIRS